ncbi:YeeE/YedE family protein [Vicingaceae bacterium]|nr:YeeE/YedE family protein [Vicingaceae bacterium]
MSTTIEKSASEADQPPVESARKNVGLSVAALFASLVVGTYFGIVLTKSEVVRWQRVHDMFLFNEPHMYLIIGMGVVVAMISMLLIKKFHVKTVRGEPIVYEPKPYHKGVIIGGTMFGAGWAITGACPGPIYAQIGGGAWMAFFTLAGALVGTFAYANLKSRLPF